MSGFNRLPFGWRLIVVLGLLAGLGQLGWAAFGGPGLVSPFSMAGMATLVATLIIGLLAWNDATNRALGGLGRSVDALDAGQYDRPVAAPVTDDQQVQALAKGLGNVQRKLADDRAARAVETAERAAADAEQHKRTQELETYARTQLTAVNTLGQGVEKLAQGDLISRLREDAFPPRPAGSPATSTPPSTTCSRPWPESWARPAASAPAVATSRPPPTTWPNARSARPLAWSAPPPPSTRSPPR